MTPSQLLVGALIVVGVMFLMFVFSAGIGAKSKPHSAGETHDSTAHAPDHGDAYVRDGDVVPED